MPAAVVPRSPGTVAPTSPLIIGFILDSKEKADLIAFLEALTDHSFLSNPEIQSPFR